jgi:hypothetical protein
MLTIAGVFVAILVLAIILIATNNYPGAPKITPTPTPTGVSQANPTIAPDSVSGGKTATPSPTLAPTEVPTATRTPETVSTRAEDYFVSGKLPDCVPVNGPWLEAFGNKQVYEIDPADTIFDHTAFNYFEGVVVPSQPTDLHSVFEMQEKFVAEQGNVWTCGVVTDEKVRHTIIFQSADKKWQNWDGQASKPFHAMNVSTFFGPWDYEAGEKPAWALGTNDTNTVCPFTEVSRSDPAGVIQPDGSFVGAPGKAGCDFVAVAPDGTALRYHDAIDSFPYLAGTRFFLFQKSFTNEEVAKAINVAVVTDAQ